MKIHTLTALVENKAGVLNRIASLFRRRRFNIESLTVGHSERPGLSRMTIVVDAEKTNLEQVVKQMYRIIEVIKVKVLDPREAVIRDLALARIAFTPKNKKELLKNIRLFNAKIVNEKNGALTIEVVGTPEKIDTFLLLTKPSGIREVSRTGATAVSGSDEESERN